MAPSGKTASKGCSVAAALVFLVALLQLGPWASLLALPVPALSARVNDYASMLSPQAKSALEAKLRQFEEQESTQIVILTIPSLEGDPVEDFSIRVAESWKIGRKGTDNGVLLIVSRDERKVRIEVGYGLEGRLTDLLAGRIVQNEIVPAFRAGKIDEGFMKGVTSIIEAVHGEYKGTPAAEKNGDAPSIPLLLLILLIFFFYWMSQVRRGHGGGGFMGPGAPGGWYPGGFGGGGGGFDSGGFSGGGGGFGGGGASGDW
ncbi:MAG: TPM domain-containing protein [Chlorobiaceae bacterium]|nr:TPM domain-containing protein [Chlorobiaceae bacterium]NTV59759.1 TPM domain-containing protein [Chlorobiaceae bacterium]